MVFHPLTKENMKQIITLLSKGSDRQMQKQLNISLTITPAAKNYIVEKHSDLKMGARPLKRASSRIWLRTPMAGRNPLREGFSREIM